MIHSFCPTFGFKPKSRNQQSLLSGIVRQNYKDIPHLSDYEYIVYYRDSVYLQSGTPDLNWLYQAKLPDAKDGESSSSLQRKAPWLNLLYKNAEGEVVLISRPLGGLTQLLSLFSYFFILLLALSTFIYLWTRFIQRDTGLFQLSLWGKPSLSNRIQLAVIIIILSSFILMGVITLSYFKDVDQVRYEQELGEKLSALQEVWQEDLMPFQNTNSLELRLKRLGTRYGLRVQLYDTSGKMLAASDPLPYKNGLLPSRLTAEAYALLRQNPLFRPFFSSKQQMDHSSMYGSLLQKDGQLAAYIGLWLESNNNSQAFNYYHFLSTLLNFYVFLLLVAAVPAIFVANSITRPLSRIGEKLQSTQLGENEPLEWKSEDEVGQLVTAYNAMIQTLAERTEKLKQKEREGAWREMAKQVAHEIKNPLTPMKLSIQYLIHAYQRNPEEVAPMLKRVSKTLIDQIDGLARIATEFSSFAKMPKPQNAHFELNESVQSVYHLFEQEQSEHIRYTLDMPPYPLPVFADKDQIMRVLNNLIKNGAQAIPEDRDGKIQISLYRKENKAVVKVSDNGTGIPDDLQEKVFQPNFTTKSSGMGLGLAICQNIMDVSGGKLYFETKEGMGTDFYMELPVVDVSHKS